MDKLETTQPGIPEILIKIGAIAGVGLIGLLFVAPAVIAYNMAPTYEIKCQDQLVYVKKSTDQFWKATGEKCIPG